MVPHVVAPTGCFFETVARIDPQNLNADYEGLGRFFTENYLLHAVGVPIQRFTPAGVVTARWMFDALFPFVCLILFSLATRANHSERGRFLRQTEDTRRTDPGAGSN